MPRQTEPNANNALGGLLQTMLPKSHVRSENTRAIAGHPGLRPDILITASDRAPVVVEAEYMPATTVEPEAKERLGLEVAANGRIIEAAIALRYPESLSEAHDLRADLSSSRLSYCVFTEGTVGVHRFPESGLAGGFGGGCGRHGAAGVCAAACCGPSGHDASGGYRRGSEAVGRYE